MSSLASCGSERHLGNLVRGIRRSAATQLAGARRRGSSQDTSVSSDSSGPTAVLCPKMRLTQPTTKKNNWQKYSFKLSHFLGQAKLVTDQRVSAAIVYMRDNLHRRLSLREIARTAQLSPVHFRRVFKHATSMPPGQYVSALRIERAKELLEDSLLSVKEIAASVGTGDVSHFVRNFKQASGMTPTAHRRLPRNK